MKMIVGVRYRYPTGLVEEFTYFYGCTGNPEQWVRAHMKAAKKATVERFESAVPVARKIWPDGHITDSPSTLDRPTSPKDWSPHWGPKVTE